MTAWSVPWRIEGIGSATRQSGTSCSTMVSPPALKRQKAITWNEFMRAHMHVLASTDFLRTEVWTWRG